MHKLELSRKKETSSFQIRKKLLPETEFHFRCEDKFFGFEGEAELIIKSTPSFLSQILEEQEEILICQNVKFNKEQIPSRLVEKHFVNLISKALAELFQFSLSHQLPGVLILLSQEEITPLTELQKSWLKDFLDLFSFVEPSRKGIHQLYMPTNFKSFQHYEELNALLERSISSTSSPLFTVL